jgi:hypothetical protein
MDRREWLITSTGMGAVSLAGERAAATDESGARIKVTARQSRPMAPRQWPRIAHRRNPAEKTEEATDIAPAIVPLLERGFRRSAIVPVWSAGYSAGVDSRQIPNVSTRS